MRADSGTAAEAGVKIIRGIFISYTNFVRHDPVRLARAIMKLVG